MIKQAVSTGACFIQRGFLAGRHFTDNVIELDMMGRALALDRGNLFPVLSFFDFRAAFPSVSNEWLVICFSACGLPAAYSNLLVSFYINVFAYGSLDGPLEYLFDVIS